MASVSSGVQQLHNSLLIDLSDMMDPSDSTYKNFIRCLVCDTLPLGRLSRVKQDPIDVFNLMEEKGVLGVGKYQHLEKALETSQYIVVLDYLKKAKECITEQMRKGRCSDDPKMDKSYNIEPETVSSIKPEDISKRRDDLIKAYKNLRCVQVSPVYEDKRCNIDSIYVDLVIEEKQDSRNTEDAQPYSRNVINVTSYKQIFQDERGSNFKRVYLRGKGGLGKTTFCRKILHAWCNAHEGRAVAQDGPFQDEAALKMFDLLFYINLREVSVEEKTLLAVIQAQFPLEEVPSEIVLTTLLKFNGDKVLFVLDGLDEMIVNAGFIEKISTRRLYSNCCFLVSSRPWKIFEMKLHKETEIDLLLDLEGFSKENAIKCAKKIFENCYKDGNVIKQFEKDLKENKLATQLIHVPLLLLFMTHVWYKKKALPSKLHELYILFLKWMAGRMKEKNKKAHRQTRFTLDGSDSQFPSKIFKMSQTLNFGEGFLLSLCEVAHHFLLCNEKENSLVFEKKMLLKALGDSGKEKLDVALDLGVLSVTDSVSYYKRKTRVSFLHKTVQEFFTAVYLILNQEKLADFICAISDFNTVEQSETVIVFLAGLMPGLVNTVLEKVNELCMAYWEMWKSEKELWRSEMKLEMGILRSLEEEEMCRLRSGMALEMDMSRSSKKLAMNENRLFFISKLYLRCKEEVTGEDAVLNVSCLCLDVNDFDPNPWNPAFLKLLYLTDSQFSYDRNFMLVDLRGLTGLSYLELHMVKCDLYLPESGSLSVLIVDHVNLSCSCCDDLDRRLAHCTKLKSLTICTTDLQSGLLDLTNMIELIDLNMSGVTMSSRCCDVFGSTLTHCTKLKKLKICHTDLHNCLLDLSNLTNLQNLDMSMVTLSSSCCDALGSTLTHFTRLKILKIYSTDLHNCLLDVSNMTELRNLHMSYVTLSRSCCDILGRTLTHCTKLKLLSISFLDHHNFVLDLSNMTELRSLNMEKLTLLDTTLTHCMKLKKLCIYNTDLRNSLLDLTNMTELIDLEISKATLSSSCCDVLGRTLTHCTKLKLLSIIMTDIHNCMFDFSNMTELARLEMTEVTLSSSCCDVLGRTLTYCTKLGLLCISDTDLHKCLLDLSNMRELKRLELSEVTLSSNCCDVLGSTLTYCTKLKILSICNTDLHNCLLDLSCMTELKKLELSEVTMSSSCCDVLGRTLTHCTKLEILSICNTDLHNCLLDLSNNSELTDLDLMKVTLSVCCCDVLGRTLTHCTKLDMLTIYNTDLHNCLLDLSNNSELRELEISEATLSSSCCDVLGSTLTHCTNLQTLRIYKTDLHNFVLDPSNMPRSCHLDLDK